MPDYMPLDARWPFLDLTNHEITSKPDPRYNCAAWVVGITSAPWWPDDDHAWFPGVVKDDSVEAMVAGYESVGFEICDSAGYDPDFEKIAIYTDPFNRIPFHVALQLESGGWTSKLGPLEDIWHSSTRAVADGIVNYGYPTIIMRKLRA